MTHSFSRLILLSYSIFLIGCSFLILACGSVTYEDDPSLSDGDDSDGDLTDGDGLEAEEDWTDGDETDGDELEDELTDGDELEDDLTDGDEIEDDLTDGDEIEDDETDGDQTDGDDPDDPVVCRPGERACYYDKLRICNADGRSFTRILCDDDQICVYDDCRDIICEPGETLCMEGHVYTCNAEGIEYTLAEYCTRPSTCRNGQCANQCENAQTIIQNQLITGSTVGAVDSVYVPSSCTMPTETGSYDTVGPDRLYRIYLENGEAIRAKLTPTSRNFDPSLYIFESCDMMPVDCKIGSDNCCSLTPEEIVYTAPHAGWYFIAVDSWENQTGDYTLKVSSYEAQSTNLRIQDVAFTLTTGVVTFTGKVVNESNRVIDKVEVGIYLTDESGTIEPGSSPDILSNVTIIQPGATKSFSIPTRFNTNGTMYAVLVADWQPVFHDSDRENNISPVQTITVAGGVNDVELALNGEVADRFLGSTSEKWYRFHCVRGRSLLVEVSAPAEVSPFDPYAELYSPLSATKITSGDEDLGNKDSHIMVACTDDSLYKLKVKYSPTAPTANRFGSYTVRLTPLQSILAKPTLLSLYPGQQTTLAAIGSFDPAITETTATVNNVVTWAVVDETIATITAAGVVTVSPLVRSGLTDVLVIPKDTRLSGVSIPLRVTTSIPGTPYGSDDELPMDIPAPNTLGMTSIIHVPDGGFLDQIAVGLSITHTSISALRVKLISPTGRQVRLHWQEGTGSTLITVYGVYKEPTDSFTSLTGEPIGGDWILNVVDTISTATATSRGRLNAWQLYLTTAQ